jgi:hypothetical protein
MDHVSKYTYVVVTTQLLYESRLKVHILCRSNKRRNTVQTMCTLYRGINTRPTYHQLSRTVRAVALSQHLTCTIHMSMSTWHTHTHTFMCHCTDCCCVCNGCSSPRTISCKCSNLWGELQYGLCRKSHAIALFTRNQARAPIIKRAMCIGVLALVVERQTLSSPVALHPQAPPSPTWEEVCCPNGQN